MAAASPAVIIHPGRHATWYGDDTQRSRAIAILNALLGSWGRRGGFFNPEKAKLPKYPMPEFPKVKYELFFDIEDDPTQEFVYMHGVYERQKGNEKYKHFTATDLKEQFVLHFCKFRISFNNRILPIMIKISS